MSFFILLFFPWIRKKIKILPNLLPTIFVYMFKKAAKAI